MTVGEMLRNRAAFAQDVQQHLAINPSDLDPLMNTTLPNDNLEVPGDVYGQFKQRACDLYMCAWAMMHILNGTAKEKLLLEYLW